VDRRDHDPESEFEFTILTLICVVGLAISVDFAIPSHPGSTQEAGPAEEAIAMAFALTAG
jgi:hypothetical protein